MNNLNENNMSLVAWYPLNGTRENKGLEDAELTWSTSPVFGDSRLVPALTQGGAYLRGVQTAKILKYKFSYCAWIKVTGGTSRILFGNDSMGSAGNSNNRHYSLYLYPTINDLHWSWQVDATSTAAGKTFAGVFNNFFPTNEWVHLAVTYGDGYFRIYKNGGRVYSEAYTGINPSTISTFAYATNIIPNTVGTSYSDIRIYDHVLSNKEISDIARGLVCHYKLDSVSGRTGNHNLLKNSWYGDGIYQAWSVTPDMNGDMVNNGDGTYSRRFIVHSNPPNWHYTGVSSSIFDLSKLKPSTKYTFSFWLKTSYTGNFQFSIIRGDATNLLTNYVYLRSTGDNQWHKYSGVLTTISEAAFNSILGGQVIYIYGLEFTGSYEYKWLKLEEGGEATDWCPSTVDNLYNKRGYSNYIEECSGYLVNNTHASSENIKLTSNSPVYDTCFNLEGASTGNILLKTPWEPNTEIKECTVSIWASTTINQTNYWNFSYNRGLRIRPQFWSSNESECSLDIIYYDGINQEQVSIPHLPLSLINGVIHNIVLTWKSGTFKCYIDGEYAGTCEIDSSIIKPNSSTCVLGSFNGTSECQIGISSDFRIYSTALTDSAIKSLYSVREFISNKGDIGCAKLIDNTSTTKFERNGLLHSPVFSEIPMFFDNTLYTENDGSRWIRIFHHNNPSSYLFSSTDSFTSPFYKDSNRWWNMTFCNYLTDKWEIMIKQQVNSGGTVESYRWIQYKNPMTATFEDVAISNVKVVTGDDYTTATNLYGGLHLMNNDRTYLCVNNGNVGNWFGAVGAISKHQGGIPGYNTIVILTGFLDVYVRVDNQKVSSELGKAAMAKNGTCQGRNFIET